MIRDFPQKLLKKNHAEGLPTRMLYLDSETNQHEYDKEVHHTMKMAWTCYVQRRADPRADTEKWIYWNETEGLCRYIEKQAKEKTKLYVFGHNVFFDLQASDFFHYFTKWGWILEFTYDKGLTYILVIKKNKRTIVILSTTNFYPVSLAVMGNVCGLVKLDVDFKEATEDELITYCKRDVEITKAIMERWYQFIAKHSLGNFAMSKAGQAFKGYRHRFMDTKINIHAEEDVISLERAAYMGGRVECGYIGKCKRGPFVSLDINSMYSFVMRNKQFPTRLIDYLENPDNEKVIRILRRFLVCAKVTLKTKEPAYAKRSDGQVVFPIGTFTAYLCTQGIEYAINNNHLVKVHELSVYEKANLFTDYVDYFYALKVKYKVDGDSTMEMIAKHFLNNLYGKFAQTTPLIEEEAEITFDGYYRREIFDAVTGQTEIETKLFNKRYIQWGTEPAKTSFAAIAAHVTEYARFYLWSCIKDVGAFRVLYMDTDSMKIRKSSIKHLSTTISKSELGALKIEEETEKLHIYALKDYETDSGRTLKGVPRHAEKVDDTHYRFTHFPRQSTHLRREVTRYFITTEMTKTLKREYKKGRVLSSGRVMPLEFSAPHSLL